MAKGDADRAVSLRVLKMINREVSLTRGCEALIVGARHPLAMPDEEGRAPRVQVRYGLEAELARPVYYELAELALAEGAEPPGFWSDGVFFPLTAV